jgi:hypothetical protein
MLKTIAAIASVPLAIIISTFFLTVTGVSYDSIRDRAQLSGVQEAGPQRFFLSDGAEVSVTCRRPLQLGIGLRCSLFQDSAYLVRLQFSEEEFASKKHWQLFSHLQLLPAQTDTFKAQLRDVPVLLSPLERSGETVLLADVSRGPLGLFVWGNYNIDREALKALVASYIAKAASIEQLDLSNADIERMAELLVGSAGIHLGLFDLRTDAYVMIFEGQMEYLIVVCFFVSLILLASSLILEERPKEGSSRGQLWSASDSIAGTLTYLGLLGTLIGMFGTVTALSRIDYVDPMVKVFDQTSSFGSMSLAIGTSVVGLAGSIVIWFAQTLTDLVRK